MVEYAIYFKRQAEGTPAGQFTLQRDGKTILSMAGSFKGDLCERVLDNLPKDSEPQLVLKVDGSLYESGVRAVREFFGQYK